MQDDKSVSQDPREYDSKIWFANTKPIFFSACVIDTALWVRGGGEVNLIYRRKYEDILVPS